jgi:hypothetical protein
LIKSHSHPQSDPTCITYTFQNGRTSLFVGTADGKVEDDEDEDDDDDDDDEDVEGVS